MTSEGSVSLFSLQNIDNLPDYVRRAPSLNIFKSMLDEVNLNIRVECDCDFCT